MKKLLLAVIIFGAAFVSCRGSKSIGSYADKDSLSYAIGVYMASNARMTDSTLNGEVLSAAWADVFAKKAKMTPDEAMAFINEWYSVRVPAQKKAESEAWLEDVKAKNPNIKTTASGLMYEILNDGDASVKAISDADQVVVKYRGTFADGKEFDANDSIALALNRVIPAWTEGMKLVGKGGEIVLWAPSDIAYGEQGSAPVVPPNSALKFEVTILDVIPAAPVE